MANSGTVQAYLHSNQGRVRTNNQDFVANWEPVKAEEEKLNGWFYILADGAGGMDAGEIASRYSTERVLHHYLSDATERDWGQRLLKAIQGANTDLRALSAQRNGGSRMATTMVATIIHGSQATIANIGDSRGYLWRRGEFKQVTRDQSLVAKLLEEGAITPEQAATHPSKHVLLYSIGSDRTPKVDLYELNLEPGDVILVCSDGLTRHVEDMEIGESLNNGLTPTTGQQLIDLANSRGGQDNISVLTIQYKPPTAGPRVIAKTAVSRPGPASRRAKVALWLYTLFLCLIQSLLILLVWAALRI